MPRQKLQKTAFAVALLVSLAPALAGDLEDGRKLMADGRYDDALAKIEKAVAADPADAAAAQALSEVLVGLGRYEEAAKAATAGLKAHEDHTGLLLAKARAYMLMADAASAAGESGNMILAYAADCDVALKALLKIEPENPDALVLKAKVLQHQGGPEEALKLLETVVAKHPDHFDANWEIAEHWYRAATGDNKNKDYWRNGEKHYRAAFAKDPTSGQAILKATFCAHWAGDPPTDLARGYEKAALLLPGEGSALKQLNVTLKSDAKARVAAFERVHEKWPDNLDVTLWLAYVKRYGGELDGAIKLLEATAKKNPTNSGVLKDLADCYFDAGKTDEAVDRYVDAIAQRKGQFVQTEYGSINLKAREGQGLSLAQREKLWTALWTAYPDHFEAPNDAGLFYRDDPRGKNPKESVKWYLRAVEAAPEDPQVLNDAGVVYHYNLGQADKAEPFYRRAIKASQDQGVEPANNGPGMGFRDALNNLSKILIAERRWADLAKFAESDVPAGFPGREQWAEMAKNKGN